MSSRTTYHRENRDIILIEQNNIMIKTEKYLESKQELPEKEKNIKREYRRNRYHNMPWENKERSKEY